ncbi:MAG: P-type conjugative transfer ATPase TrbB [Endozoicomonas sp. (ex Botrylloides leachii)]|nr:P-type conjugative transfer ATPase TrbB [Endozoicomonas sp. (ex Botrylloides leachii)]
MTVDIDSTKQRAREKLAREVGQEILNLLEQTTTIELMCNQDGKLWIDQLGKPMQVVGCLSSWRVESIIRTVSGYLGKTTTRNSPLLEGEWPLDGSRFAAQLPPIVPQGIFSIRKKASAIFTLAQYVTSGVMTQTQSNTLCQAITNHQNILLSGGCGSGKTTLANGVIHEMVKTFPNERIFIIEDNGEIQCTAENFVQYLTSSEANVDMTQLLKTTLRMRPDRILVGEVRGAEALDLIDAWNTGHPGGVATIHANSAIDSLTRMKSLISRNQAAPREIEPLIADAVHLVVFIKKDPAIPAGRCIDEIIEVIGYENNQYLIRAL